MTTVIQGTPVASPYGHGNKHQGSSGNRGEKQETKCRDPLFALLLYANVAAIVAVAAIYGPAALKYDVQNQQSSGESEYEPYLYAAVVSGGVGIILSALMLLVMMRIASVLIKMSLFFVIALSALWVVFAIFSKSIAMAVFSIIYLLLTLCYARAVWSRIPFATSNLVTACTAVRSNCGVTFIAYIMVIVAFGWSLLWTIAMLGIFDQTYNCPEDAQGQSACSPNYGYLFLLFVSYFFTHQVIQNTVHVTVAGTVGTWWFVPEDSGCCSAAVCGSFIRATTTSFGSICFGSLIVAIIQALRQIADTARHNDDANPILVCVVDCILGCIQSIVEYFNKWAYIYVGLYGYSYLDAGRNVITLFKNRGWEAIIADNLVGNTLFLVSVIVGAISGCVGILVEIRSGWFSDAVAGDGKIVAFVIGFIIGLVVCSIQMSVIGSAVNAVIVCFAEAPGEFERHYPVLSAQMREAWTNVYPGCL